MRIFCFISLEPDRAHVVAPGGNFAPSKYLIASSLGMSLSSFLPRRIPHPQAFYVPKRYVSSKQASTLPDYKKRALISLYHQSESFITPENLVERIDEAFRSSLSTGKLHETPPEVWDLKSVVRVTRTAPKLKQWVPNEQTDEEIKTPVSNGLGDGSKSWSQATSRRENKVLAALYGVHMTPSGQILPGLEVLEESAEKLEASLKADGKNERGKRRAARPTRNYAL